MNIYDKIYELERNSVKKELTHNLGKVEELPDKLICYVKKSILKSKGFNETLLCYGINFNNVKLANDYNLNKPIYYVFEGLERYNQMLNIDGCYEATIIINNSKLENIFLDIRTDGKLIINDTTLMGNLFFRLKTKVLELNRCYIKYMYNKDTIYYLYGENSIKMKDSMVGNSRVNLNFETPNLTLNGGNSFIGKNIDIRGVKNLICDDDTTIKAKERVNIDADALNQIDVYAPSIVVNECEYKSQFVRKEYREEIDQKRGELLDMLAIIRDKYINRYDAILNDKKEELYNLPIERSLKK